MAAYFENFNNPGYFNPVSIIKNAVDDTKYGSLQGNFTVEAKLPFNLTYNLNLAYQRGTWLHGEYYNSYYSQNYSTGKFYTNGDPGGGRSPRNFYSNGLAYRGYYQSSSKTLESFLTWGKKMGSHNLKAVLGYSWQKNTNNDGVQASQTNFVNDYTGYNNLGLGNYQTVNGFAVDYGGAVYEETNFISDFFRLNYDYKRKNSWYRLLLDEMAVLYLAKIKSGGIFQRQVLPGVFQKKTLLRTYLSLAI